jgi:AcrR family transcriptional regulator
MATTTTDSEPRVSEPRERLLRVASDLFYRDGINTVGVDRILGEAEVTRATLYRHFAGKEGLVEAYLDREDQIIRGYFATAEAHATSAQHYLELAVSGIADDALHHHTRGCPFINASAEYPDPDSPVRQRVSRHREWFRQALQSALANAGKSDPADRARTLVLLRDAALIGGYLDGSDSVSRTFVKAARAAAGLE